MKKYSFQSTILLCAFFLINTTVDAQIITTSKSNDTTAVTFNSSSHYFSNTTGYTYPFKREAKEVPGTTTYHVEEQYLSQRDPLMNIGLPFDNSAPSEIHSKYFIKPVPGNLNSNSLNTAEDLLHGKVNLSIPLTTFSYYDYQIPVTINNRYPQIMKNTMSDPVFYANSRVGGDWSLSINNYKVSRQVNGVPDEHPTKGYFSTFSQSRINNPSLISNSDVQTGLEGDWDPKIDVFHFSTPTISGSFLINLTGGYEILSQNKFVVDYQLINDKLNEFTITDSEGNKFIFGGDDSSIELYQSKTNIQVFKSSEPSSNRNFAHIYVIFETNNSGDIIGIEQYPAYKNLFTFEPNWGGSGGSAPNSNQLLLDIVNDDNVNAYLNFLRDLPDEDPNRKYYALVDFRAPENHIAQIPVTNPEDDPDLRQSTVEVGWYLNEIILYNGKKIDFQYNNYKWEVYPTYNSTLTEVDLWKSREDFTFHYPNNVNPTDLANVFGFPFFPEFLDQTQAVNEVHTETFHYIKRPEISNITDEDYFQGLTVNYGSYADPNAQIAPYVVSPNTYPISPPETLNNGYRSFLIKDIKHTVNNCFPIDNCSTTIDFNNVSFIETSTNPNDPSEIINLNREDRSFLNSVTIDDQTTYKFEYEGQTYASRLKKIIYPTGGTKEFSSIDPEINITRFQAFPYRGFNEEIYVKRPAPRLDKIVSTSESNILEESYEYGLGIFSEGTYWDTKTYREGETVTAKYITTSPMFNSHFLLNGYGFQEVTKRINGIVQSKVTFSAETNSILPDLILTDGSNQEDVDVQRPRTYHDQMIGLNEETKAYSNNEVDDDNLLNESTSTRVFSQPNVSSYPSIYLTNIEAGPWTNTPGSIRKAYSVFNYPFESQVMQLDIVSNEYVNNVAFSKTVINKFDRTLIPSLGLDNYRLVESSTIGSKGEQYKTMFRTPIEVAGLSSTSNNVVVQNPALDELLRNNRAPNLETIQLKDAKIIGGSSSVFKKRSSGNQIAVPYVSMSYESEIYENESNFAVQAVDPNSSYNILYDDKLVDKIKFDKYDDNGRLIEYHTIDDNVYTSLIWGYQNQLPVAVISNAKYTEVQNFASQIANINNNNGQIMQLAQNIRDALTDAQVKSYTYQGKLLESETDAKGETIYYTYDDVGRLDKILDRDENILKEYRYHYANLIDDPINGYIFTTHDLENKEVTFTIEFLTGGSGQYTYNWNLLEGGTQNGTDNTFSFSVSYDCLANIDHLEVEVIVQDAIDPANNNTFYQSFYDLDCCPPLFSGNAIVTEIRSFNNFEGLELKIEDLQGGCGPYKYNWRYRVDGGTEYPLISTFNATTILSDSHSAFQDICEENVTFTCNISDLGIDEPLSASYPLTTGSQYVDCSDNPN